MTKNMASARVVASFTQKHKTNTKNSKYQTREYKRGEYDCVVDLLFDWFGLVCFANRNKNCQ